MATNGFDIKYKWVKAWGMILGSYGYYIDAQLGLAHTDNAPENATHKNADGTWSTLDDVVNEATRDQLERLVGEKIPESKAYIENKIQYAKENLEFAETRVIECQNELTELQHKLKEFDDGKS